MAKVNVNNRRVGGITLVKGNSVSPSTKATATRKSFRRKAKRLLRKFKKSVDVQPFVLGCVSIIVSIISLFFPEWRFFGAGMMTMGLFLVFCGLILVKEN